MELPLPARTDAQRARFDEAALAFRDLYQDALVDVEDKLGPLGDRLCELRAIRDSFDALVSARLDATRKDEAQYLARDLQDVSAELHDYAAQLDALRDAGELRRRTELARQEPPSEITEYLLLGSEANAAAEPALAEAGVTHVLVVAAQCEPLFPTAFSYLHIRLYDSPDERLRRHLPRGIAFIERAKAVGGRVLVHCQEGVSRSATFVLAYLIQRHEWGLDEALDYVRRRRPAVRPNGGFLEQLRRFAAGGLAPAVAAEVSAEADEPPEVDQGEQARRLSAAEADVKELADRLRDRSLSSATKHGLKMRLARKKAEVKRLSRTK